MLTAPTSLVLGDGYRLGDRIGEGGGGQVYRAARAGAVVAIKILGPGGELEDAARARLEREIAALGKIAHPALVPLLDHGVDPELGPFLVLPLLPGTTLRKLVGGRALCPEAALLLIQPIVHAVAALHAGGFVHRDLKPENAIAAPSGTVTVIDLGLVWGDGMSRHTDTGTAVGSVGYMSPEQIEGRRVDERADIWAIGVMLYELIAGKRPFARPRAAEEAAAALLGAHAKLAAADRRAGAELAELVERCLSADPAGRPAAAELAASIDALVDWTDDADGERATAIADPAAYQARVAAFRIRRVERLAREAIDAGTPFAAVALCDRGLAYDPDHAGLLALVAVAEAATGDRPALVRRRRISWRWIAGAVASIATIVIAIVLWRAPSSPEDADDPGDPWATTGLSPPTNAAPSPTPTVELVPDERDRALVGNFVSVFGRMVERPPQESGSNQPMTEQDRALARDVVHLFGQFIDRAAPEPKPDR